MASELHERLIRQRKADWRSKPKDMAYHRRRQRWMDPDRYGVGPEEMR